MDIYVNYEQMKWVFVGVFAFVGLFRGWLKELFTSFLLVLMALPLVYPSLADTIITFFNKLVQMFSAFLSVVNSSDTTVQSNAFTESNSYTLFIIILGALVILSYMSDRIGLKQSEMSAFSAALGGLLGAFNGFLILSLVKDYVLGNFFATQGMQTQAMPTISDMTMSIENVPPEPFYQSMGTILPIVLVGGIFVILFGRVFRVQAPIAKK